MTTITIYYHLILLFNNLYTYIIYLSTQFYFPFNGNFRIHLFRQILKTYDLGYLFVRIFLLLIILCFCNFVFLSSEVYNLTIKVNDNQKGFLFDQKKKRIKVNINIINNLNVAKEKNYIILSLSIERELMIS
jgi:hypothetical protein